MRRALFVLTVLAASGAGASETPAPNPGASREESIAASSEALAADPQNADAHAALGDALLTLGRVDEAERHLLRALRLRSSWPGILYHLGVIERRRGDEQAQVGHDVRARAHWVKAVRRFEEQLRVDAGFADTVEAHEQVTARLAASKDPLPALEAWLAHPSADPSEAETLARALAAVARWSELADLPFLFPGGDDEATRSVDRVVVRLLLEAAQYDEGEGLLVRIAERDDPADLVAHAIVAAFDGDAAVATRHLESLLTRGAPEQDVELAKRGVSDLLIRRSVRDLENESKCCGTAEGRCDTIRYPEAFAGGTRPVPTQMRRRLVYPERLRLARLEAKTTIDSVVLPDGTPVPIAVRWPAEQDVVHECVKALRGWRFEPGTLEGRPVSMLYTNIFKFTLR